MSNMKKLTEGEEEEEGGGREEEGGGGGKKFLNYNKLSF